MIPKSTLCYLATPYSKYSAGLDTAAVHASNLAGRLILAGISVYSPIAHCHPIALHAGIDPLDHKLWIAFDEAMMRAADVLLVAHMDGWQDSHGVAHEIDFFTRASKPIFDLDPQSLSMVKRK